MGKPFNSIKNNSNYSITGVIMLNFTLLATNNDWIWRQRREWNHN